MVEPEEEDEEEGVEEPEAQSEQEEEKEKDQEIDWEEILLDGFDTGGRREEHEEKEYYEPVTSTRATGRPPPRSDHALVSTAAS
jgi:RNA polymerase sigma-54 factor